MSSLIFNKMFSLYLFGTKLVSESRKLRNKKAILQNFYPLKTVKRKPINTNFRQLIKKLFKKIFKLKMYQTT
jgi:hypothetical protein